MAEHITRTTVTDTHAHTPRSEPFRPRRRRWPGFLAAGLLGAAVAAVVVSSYYDPRSIGQRLDAGIAATQQGVEQGAQAVADQGNLAGQQMAEAFSDAGITVAVKRALAADPALSALKIDVDTQDGVVRLRGPAPDEKSRERAGVLAAAPQGVRSVENQLIVGAPSNG